MPWRERLYLACFYPLDTFRIKIYQLILFLFFVLVVTGGFAFHAANASELTTNSDKGQTAAEPASFSLETQLLNHPSLRQSAARSCRAIFVLGQRKAEKKLDLSASLSGERQLASNFKTSNSDPLPSSVRAYNHAYDDIYDIELTARYRLYDWGVGSARVRAEENSLHAERLGYQVGLTTVVEDILRVMMQIESAQQEISYRTTALREIAPHVEAIEAQGKAGSIGLAQVRETKLSVLNAEIALQRAERRFDESQKELNERFKMRYEDALPLLTAFLDVRSGEVMPIEARDWLNVRARLLPQDVADVALGQLARISLSAYDVSRYGALEGAVVHVASNTTEEQNVPPYYETLIEIGDKGFPNSNVVPDIVPGMQVTVDIIGGKRTVLDYILSPIQKAAAVAFREK